MVNCQNVLWCCSSWPLRIQAKRSCCSEDTQECLQHWSSSPSLCTCKWVTIRPDTVCSISECQMITDSNSSNSQTSFFFSDPHLLDAILQHGPHFHLHFFFRWWTRYIYWSRFWPIFREFWYSVLSLQFENYTILHLRIKSFLCFWHSAGATAPLPGEIFTQSFKSAGYTIACTINWAGLFVLGMVFPILVVSTLQSWSNLAYS